METCSICNQPIPAEHGGKWTHGHNADPVTPDRCCGLCNDTYVIPFRIALMMSGKAKANVEAQLRKLQSKLRGKK